MLRFNSPVSAYIRCKFVNTLSASRCFRYSLALKEDFMSQEMTELETINFSRSAGDRKFYSLPQKYENIYSNSGVSQESSTLLNEIYSNVCSKNAKFDGPYGVRSVVYCDYAASGQALNFIEDYIKSSVLPFYANTHSTTTATSMQSTYYRHEARDLIRKAVNASEHDAVIFTGSGCTSAVNKLIHALNFASTVVVFIGPYEHHSNLLPWREINAKIVRVRETSNGLIDIQNLEDELKRYHDKGHYLIGSFSAASNVTGIVSDDIRISILLHKYGALSFWDYAAGGPYLKIDMNPVVLGEDQGLAYKDAIFLSPHKFVGGPETPGLLIAKKYLFSNPVPSEPGGGTVFFVTRKTHRYLKDIEMKEEGGTPSIIGAIRAGMVFQLKEAVGTGVILEREKDIFRKVMSKWKSYSELKVLGDTTVYRLPIFSFVIYHSKSGLYLHHNFVCALLNDLYGIQTRSGCACAGPYALDLLGIDETLAQEFDVLLAEESSLDRVHLRRKEEYSEYEVLRPGFVRLTIPYFMSDKDIDFVINAVSMIAENGWKLLPQYSFNPQTGEWKHKTKQVFTNRKWLGSISYQTGVFKIKENNLFCLSPNDSEDVLEASQKYFEKAREVAMKKFSPDQCHIFDAKSSKLRWFLLPSEAKQYLAGDTDTKIKTPVFKIRTMCYKYTVDDNSHKISTTLFTLATNDENSNPHPVFAQCCGKPAENTKKEEMGINSSIVCQNKNLIFSKNILYDYGPLQCRWHSPPSRTFHQFLKAVTNFQMIQNGDRVLICLSGGKDSLSLLHILHQYNFYAKKQNINFHIGAVTIDPKSPLFDPSPLKGYLKSLNMPYFYEEQDIISQAAALEKCTSICSFCSRLKRGKIYACAKREGYNVVALGQHLDDFAESFFMSIFHNGRLRTMKANYLDETGSIRVIRPLVFVREKDLRSFAEKKKLPVISENCPACFEAPTERHRIKQLLASQEVQFPNIYRSIQKALLPLMSFSACGQEDEFLKTHKLPHIIQDDDFEF